MALVPTLPLKLWQDQCLADPQTDPFHRIPESEDRKVPHERLRKPLLAQDFTRRFLLEDIENLPAIILKIDGVCG